MEISIGVGRKRKELPTGDGGKEKQKRKQLATGDGPKRNYRICLPHITKDPGEIERLSKRRLPDLPKSSTFRCWACLSKKHITRNCPCLDKIPEGQTLGPAYDYACILCGKLDIHPCHNLGHYAVKKVCSGCRQPGHWYWERKCPKGQIFNPKVAKPKDVEWEEIPHPFKMGEIVFNLPGYWKIKEVESSNPDQIQIQIQNQNQSNNKWKSIGSKLVNGVKKLVL